MNISEYTQPDKLERYSFLWSEARLVIGAAALFLGAVPPLTYLPLPWGLMNTILTLAWIISGVAAAYLLYRWYKANWVVFGGKAQMDMAALGVSIVSGINLGLTGILRNNIGLSISSNQVVLIIVGVLYLAAAFQLYTRWSSYGKKIF